MPTTPGDPNRQGSHFPSSGWHLSPSAHGRVPRGTSTRRSCQFRPPHRMGSSRRSWSGGTGQPDRDELPQGCSLLTSGANHGQILLATGEPLMGIPPIFALCPSTLGRGGDPPLSVAQNRCISPGPDPAHPFGRQTSIYMNTGPLTMKLCMPSGLRQTQADSKASQWADCAGSKCR